MYQWTTLSLPSLIVCFALTSFSGLKLTCFCFGFQKRSSTSLLYETVFIRLEIIISIDNILFYYVRYTLILLHIRNTSFSPMSWRKTIVIYIYIFRLYSQPHLLVSFKCKFFDKNTLKPVNRDTCSLIGLQRDVRTWILRLFLQSFEQRTCSIF